MVMRYNDKNTTDVSAYKETEGLAPEVWFVLLTNLGVSGSLRFPSAASFRGPARRSSRLRILNPCNSITLGV